MGDKRSISGPLLWPSVANIGLTRRCNSRCVMCVASDGGTDMSITVLDELIRQLSQYPIDTYSWTGNIGEPLMAPGLLQRAIGAARRCSPKSRQMVFTNAALLTREVSERLISEGLTDITFSIDSLDVDTYESVRRGLKLEVVLANVDEFIALNEAAGHPVQTRVHAVISTQAMIDTVPAMRERWKHDVDGFSWLPCDGRGPTACFIEESDDWPCHSPFSGIFVEPNGDFLFCCQDGLGKYPMGHFPKESVKQIWNGERYAFVRKAHLNGKKKSLALCKKCHTYY